MTEELPEAPYTFIWEERIVDGKKVKVYFLGKYGKEFLNKIEGLATEKWVTSILNRLVELEDVTLHELVPFVKDDIVDYIKSHVGINSKQLNKHLFSTNAFQTRVNFTAKYKLEREGKIVSQKVGRGQPRKWFVKEKEA